MSELDDENINRLAGRIRESDRRAYDDLFRILYPRLVHYAMRYVRRKDVACDIVQDAFVILWQKRSDIDPNRALKAFMYTTVRNRSINWLKSYAGRSESLDGIPALKIVSSESHDTGFSSESDQMNKTTLADLFRNWITELPERQQEAFELSRYEGMSHEEISDIMNISPKTVNNHIVSALSHLRSRYDKYQQTEKEG